MESGRRERGLQGSERGAGEGREGGERDKDLERGRKTEIVEEAAAEAAAKFQE